MRIRFNQNLFKFFLFLIITASILYSCRYFHPDIQTLKKSLEGVPLFYSGIIFVGLYVVTTFFIWFIKDAFKVIGVLVFGAYISALLIFISETINAVILFFLARFLGRDFVERFFKGTKNVSERIARLNLFWLFLFRAAPLFPFRALDLGAGLSRVSFQKYFFTVLIGSPLRILWLQLMLAVLGEAYFASPFNTGLILQYLLQHKGVLIFIYAYIFLVIVVLIKAGRKE